VQAALDMIAAKECDVNIMTTHRFSLERTQEAFDLVESYQGGVVKAMIVI
jgi:threonine dehydrogenase-like Zn-dependent dehydrogenase